MNPLPPGLITEPGSSVANETGGWRTERPKFLLLACTGCDICALSCPEGVVVAYGKNRYGYDPAYCKGCGICAEECPVHDIVMEDEPS